MASEKQEEWQRCFILLSQILFDTCVCVFVSNIKTIIFLSFQCIKPARMSNEYSFLCMSHNTTEAIVQSRPKLSQLVWMFFIRNIQIQNSP